MLVQPPCSVLSRRPRASPMSLGRLRNIVASIGMSGCRRTGALVANRDWKRRFQDSKLLPRGRRLATLEDSGRYLTKLPKAEHEAQECQAATEALIPIATSGGPTMFAHIGVMGTLNRHVRVCSMPTGKTIIGVVGSWRGIDRRHAPAGRLAYTISLSCLLSETVPLWVALVRRPVGMMIKGD
jgi:hypothetical protein